MELTIQTFLIVCPLVFLAGLVDSIAGGGGLISLPAYLLAGVPMHNAIATNKLSSATGTAISTARLCKNKFVDWGVALPCISMALVGSFAGAHIALLASDKILKWMLIPVLPIVAFYVMKKKNLDDNSNVEISRKKQWILCAVFSGCWLLRWLLWAGNWYVSAYFIYRSSKTSRSESFRNYETCKSFF